MTRGKGHYDEVEEIHTFKYSFGVEPLVPDVRNRIDSRTLIEAASVAEMIGELKSENIRKPRGELA